MSKKKTALTKKQQKQLKKAVKKNPAIFVVISVLLVIAIAIGVAIYFLKNNNDGSGEKKREPDPEPVVAGEVEINFLEFGNNSVGDATYIKIGDVDILIDSGSARSCATTISNYIKNKMTDNKIEYVIATHAHGDHIPGFVGTNKIPGIFDRFEIGTIIQFSRTNATSSLYSEYCAKVESLKATGTKVYGAQSLIESKNATFTIADGITLTILDQRYYREYSNNENNYSVCAMLNHGNNHYLFTGDLATEGEASLVSLNNLPKVQLYKGAHHGSYTSNTDTLLSVIQPEVVCICTCLGTHQYTENPDYVFPARIVCETIHKYTDKVYITSSLIDGVYAPMNGNITFKCSNGVDYTVHGSNNDTKLKDTDWYKANRM